MSDFHFLRPHFLFLLIPFFVLIILLMRKKSHASSWSQVCSKDLLPYMITENSSKSSSFFYTLMSVTIASLIIGFAGPTWQSIPQPLIKSVASLVIVLDLSPLMDSEDIKPSRLKRAIYKVNDLLETRKDGQTALIVFSGDPFIVTPLTDDVETIKALLPVLDTSLMPSSGHRVSTAISKATELFVQAGRSNGSILLVTSAISATELGKSVDTALKEGVSISVLGVGTNENAPIPKQNGGFVQDDKGALVISTLAIDSLAQLANSTHGKYVTISLDDSDIQSLSDHFNDLHQLQSKDESAASQTKWQDQGYLFVLMILPIFSLLFRRGVLLAFCLFLPHAVQASSWGHFFKTPDQQAEACFYQAEYQKAKELFQNPDWQGATNYRLGEYEAAAEVFQNNESPDGLYNFGTAKAKLGDFESALKAYQAVLEKQPDHEDALHNKKLIEDWQKQQQDQQQNQSGQNQSNDQQKNQNQSNDQQQNQSGQDQPNDQQKDQNQTNDQQQDQQTDQNQKQSDDQKQKQPNNQHHSQPQNQNGQQDQSAQQKPNQNEDQGRKEDQRNSQRSKQQEQQGSQKSNKQQQPSQDSKDQLDQMNDELEDHSLHQQYKNQVDKELEKDQKQPEKENAIAQQEMSPDEQQRQIDDRWLQRIPDDPGALLRRKFMYQHKQIKGLSR